MTDQVTEFQQMLKGDSVKNTTPDLGASNDFTNVLGEIVNEKGEPKYSNVEEALKALKASQDHISTLESENSQLRERTHSASTIEDILAELDSTKNKNGDNQQSFSMEDITGLVEQTLEKRQAQERAQGNLGAVKGKLTDTYGEKAAETYAEKAKDLGLSVEMMDHLAAISPQAVLAYFDSKSKPTGKNLQGSVNTEAFQLHNQTAQAPKSVMFGASTKDMVNAWKATYDQLNQN